MSSIAQFDRSREFGSDRPRSMENIHSIVAEFYLSVTVSSLRVCSGIHKTPQLQTPSNRVQDGIVVHHKNQWFFC